MDGFRQKLQQETLNPFFFSLLAILVGVISGLGAVLFRGLIGLVHNLLFFGQFTWVYDANAHTPPSPWGVWVILVPVAGALGVAFLVQNFAPEAKGHGVPEVIDAIYYEHGRIRPVVAMVKALASALSIGSGGAVGREGPIIQIGSSMGSTLGQWLPMPAWLRNTLIAAGAGGGIAATFNTPVGGILFVVELMMQEVSVRTLVPIALSTATATYIGRLFFGDHPSFVIPALQTPYFHIANPLVLLAYVGLGLLLGGVSALYIRAIYGFEDLFEKRIGGSYYRRHVGGMLAVGVLIYGTMATCGHYYIEGVGYATVQDVLSGSLASVTLLLTLCVLKLLVTSLTLGSGASGGIFSPALFIGATLGGAYGVLISHLFPGLGLGPPAFAVAGMAAVVGGSTGAALAAIVMIFEMTLDYSVIIPVTITVVIAYGIRKLLCPQSIYTLKLVRRGHPIPEALQTNLHQHRPARDFMDTEVIFVPAATTLDEFGRLLAGHPREPACVVTAGERIVGVLDAPMAVEALLLADRQTLMGDLADRDFLTVPLETRLFDVIVALHARHLSMALVVDGPGPAGVKGLITRFQIAEIFEDSVELFTR
jgi:chloride channel protein, CIC family